MAGGGSSPGERRGGRRPGSRNKTTIERETVEAEVRAGRIAAGIAMPILAKEKLEFLLSAALRHMEEAFASGVMADYIAWFERAGALAKALAPYQSPQLKTLAVAHTDMRPSPIDLSKLTDRQLEQLRRLIQLAGPSNIPGGGRDGRNADALAIADSRPGSPTKSRSAALGANGRHVLPAFSPPAPLRKRSARAARRSGNIAVGRGCQRIAP
jgi:hypothetical protein